MATATAKRGRGKGTKEPAPAPKKKRPRAKNGQGKQPATQQAFLLSVKADNPLITADEFALKFNLPPDEVARHRAFCLQFLLDYNVKGAALRMGYPEATAYDTGRLMLGYAFSQLFISECQRAATVESVVSHGQIMAKAWEEANRGDTIKDGCVMTNSGTRLSALTLAARIAGLLNPKPKEEAPVIRRIMYVAAPALQTAQSPEQWGTVAKTSQKALKASTVIDI